MGKEGQEEGPEAAAPLGLGVIALTPPPEHLATLSSKIIDFVLI